VESNEPNTPIALDPSVAHNARLGITFFSIYFLLYTGFIVIVTFKYEWMGRPVLGGLNLAITYGIALILAAIVLAIVYVMMCRPVNNQA
jgi:uncharacterized membrane protein (DUF485 family)